MSRRLPLCPRPRVAAIASPTAQPPPAHPVAHVLVGVAACTAGDDLLELGELLVERLVARACPVRALLLPEPATEHELASAEAALRARGAAAVACVRLGDHEGFAQVQAALREWPTEGVVVALGNPLLWHVRPRLAVLVGATRPRALWLVSARAVAGRAQLQVARGGPALADALADAFTTRRASR